MKDDRSFLKNLVLITQVGLSMIVPIGLMIVVGLFLKDRLNASWVLVLCILLGIGGGISATWGLLKKFAPKVSDDEPREDYDLMKNWKRPEEDKRDGEDDFL